MTILTLAEYRAFEESELGDVPLQTLLDAAEIEIVRFAGPPTTAIEWFGGGHRTVYLNRPASAITSIVETPDSWWGGAPVTLATDDYLLYPGGFAIGRLSGGTHSHSCWTGRVAITYTPLDDASLRKAVQADLVSLALNATAGAIEESIGAWTEKFASAADNDERDAILGRLSYGPSLVVVGQ